MTAQRVRTELSWPTSRSRSALGGVRPGQYVPAENPHPAVLRRPWGPLRGEPFLQAGRKSDAEARAGHRERRHGEGERLANAPRLFILTLGTLGQQLSNMPCAPDAFSFALTQA